MGVLSDLKKRWFVTVLIVAANLFFAGALVFSTLTYADVMEARQGVELRNAVEAAAELENGSLLVSFSIDVYNPSGKDLLVHSLSWAVRVYNSTAAVPSYLFVTSAYNSSGEGLVFPGESTTRLSYSSIVPSGTTLQRLVDFVAYSSSQGQDYTLSTMPFVHDFRMVAFTGGFDHDYQYYRELYLNDIVRVERTYYGGEYL
jgi:hypothetical protein